MKGLAAGNFKNMVGITKEYEARLGFFYSIPSVLLGFPVWGSHESPFKEGLTQQSSSDNNGCSSKDKNDSNSKLIVIARNYGSDDCNKRLAKDGKSSGCFRFCGLSGV